MELEWPQMLIVMQGHLLKVKLNEALVPSQVENFAESSTFM